jgi:cyclic beta-1,2-glucan synthetase
MANSTISPGSPESPAADVLTPAPTPLRVEGAGHLSLLQAVTALAREGANAEPPGSRDLLRRFRDNARSLERATTKLGLLTAAGNPVPGETEWLLDNYYIIEEVVREVQTDLPRRYYRELPALGFGPFTGMPRIYPVAATLLGHTDSALSEPQIREVVKAYQETTPLSTGEVWAVPTMLRLALLENLRRLGDQIMATIASCGEATAVIEAARTQRVPRLPRLPSDAFIVALADGLRDNEPQPGAGADAVEAWSTRFLVDLAQARHREYSRQAANQVSIGNAITSLRLLGVIAWPVFFEATSLVEAELRTDPGEVYPRQDFPTRDRCRRVVERLARGSGWNEVGVARAASTAATAHAGDPLTGQVSWFLLGDGRAEFERSLGYRPRWADRRRGWLLDQPYAAYFGSLLGLLALLLVPAIVLSWHGVLPALLVALACLLPASEVAVSLTNFLLCRLLPPRVLPRLDLRQGIPADCTTFVVIPTLIGKPAQAAGLVERLEQHYLANPDASLVFALLTDFTDSPTETTPTDEECVRNLLAGIAHLNARYAPQSTARFFLFHRKRQFDLPESTWMGWERKRGKLQEFNDLLRGATHTSFTTTSVPLAAVPRVRFVLTLDTDTVMQRDAARSMIAALAHPLNAPRLSADGRRVEGGYGVLQPRVSFLYTTGFRSWFAKLFAGSVGIDPYSTAVSDTYMDLFDRGTFTGKGLYDVDAFRATADRAFPDNHILSHDLIESNYVRCALASDVEVFDEFPARYHACARRDHRWVRGDWQLLPWLGPTVPLPDGGRAPNILPALERWKIVDNLRRSLVPTGVVALILLGGTVLPGSALGWLLLALLPFLTPPALYVIQAMVRMLGGAPPRAEFARAGTDLVNTLGQSALQAVLIANQAWLLLDAILRTLWRLLVSRRHLLEWETAAATENRLGSGLMMFVATMWPACLIAAAGAGLVWLVAPEDLLVLGPVFAAWMLSPLVAWGVSAPRRLAETPLAPEQVRELRRIMRKTWDFFETFVGAEDNWLPPDNYQEVPRDIVAHRTSPTNMGLYLLATLAAHDFGYIGTEDMIARLKHSLDTFDRLERHRGHFINWYETNTLVTLHPAYVSTVDSGNLLACLITLANGLVEKARFQPSDAPWQGLRDTLVLVETEWVPLRDKATPEARKAIGDALGEVSQAAEIMLPSPPGRRGRGVGGEGV